MSDPYADLVAVRAELDAAKRRVRELQRRESEAFHRWSADGDMTLSEFNEWVNAQISRLPERDKLRQ